eukprot:832650_1
MGEVDDIAFSGANLRLSTPSIDLTGSALSTRAPASPLDDCRPTNEPAASGGTGEKEEACIGAVSPAKTDLAKRSDSLRLDRPLCMVERCCAFIEVELFGNMSPAAERCCGSTDDPENRLLSDLSSLPSELSDKAGRSAIDVSETDSKSGFGKPSE